MLEYVPNARIPKPSHPLTGSAGDVGDLEGLVGAEPAVLFVHDGPTPGMSAQAHGDTLCGNACAAEPQGSGCGCIRGME